MKSVRTRNINPKQRNLIVLLIIIGGIILIVGAIALAMSQYWCEPCQVIKIIGG